MAIDSFRHSIRTLDIRITLSNTHPLGIQQRCGRHIRDLIVKSRAERKGRFSLATSLEIARLTYNTLEILEVGLPRIIGVRALKVRRLSKGNEGGIRTRQSDGQSIEQR
jgi:hypothetical protein